MPTKRVGVTITGQSLKDTILAKLSAAIYDTAFSTREWLVLRPLKGIQVTITHFPIG